MIAIIGILVVNAGWIAVTARYPQAFDENYHLGLIQLHAAQWLPYFTAQPPGDALYGALARDPSYLYHFLLSLPYRLIALLTDNQVVQVITLRAINIAIFVIGLYIYRRVLRELGASASTAHSILLFFVLLPITPLLAAQINYDNLMFLMVGWLFLLAVRYYQLLYKQRSGSLVSTGLLLVAVAASGSLVKYPFLAIAGTTLFALTVLTWRRSRRRGFEWRIAHGTKERYKLLACAIFALISLGLCVERYGVNVVRYHDPVPSCDSILSIDQCMAYSPWARNYEYAQVYPRPSLQGMLVYTPVWIHRMVYETVFTISSTYGEEDTGNTVKVYYFVYDPLPLPSIAAWVVTVVGGIALAVFWRSWWRNLPLRILLGVTALYTIVLLAQNFQSYMQTGEVVAVHGRYLVPVFPVIFLAMVCALRAALQRYNVQRYSIVFVIVTLILLLQGGGALTFILRSEPFWFWPYNPLAGQLNEVVQHILRFIIIH